MASSSSSSSSSSSTPGPLCPRSSRSRRNSPLALMFAAWGAAATAASVPQVAAASIERGVTLGQRSDTLRQALIRRNAVLSDSDIVTIAGKVPLDAVILVGTALLFALVCAAFILVRVRRGERGEVALERKQARRDLRLRGSTSHSGHSSPRHASREKVHVASSTVNSTASSTAPLVPQALDFPKLERETSAAIMSSSRAGHRVSVTGGHRVSIVGQRKSTSSARRPNMADMKRNSAFGDSRRSLHSQERYREIGDAPPRPGSKYRSRAMSDDAVLQVPVLRPQRTNTNSSHETEALTDLELQTDEGYGAKRRPVGPRAPSENRKSTSVARGVNLAAQRSLNRKKQPVAVNPQSVERSYSPPRPGNHRSSSSRSGVPSSNQHVSSSREPFGKLEVRRSDSDLEAYMDSPVRRGGDELGARLSDILSTTSSFTSPSLTGAPLSPPEAIRGGFETPPAGRDSPAEAPMDGPWVNTNAWRAFMTDASGGSCVEAPTTETPVRQGSRKARSTQYSDSDTPQQRGWRAYDSSSAPPPPQPSSRWHTASSSPPKMSALLPTASNERPGHRRQGTGSSAGRPKGARPMGGTYDVDLDAFAAHDDQRLL